MEIRARSTNVVGMKLTIPHTYIEDRSQVIEVHTLAEVVKTQRSSDGFKTSTGTTRTCHQCREEGGGVSGVEPWPVAVWLLTAEVLGNRRVTQLALCSGHFKELREKDRKTRARMGEVLAEMVFNPDFDSDGSPWEPVSPPQ